MSCGVSSIAMVTNGLGAILVIGVGGAVGIGLVALYKAMRNMR